MKLITKVLLGLTGAGLAGYGAYKFNEHHTVGNLGVGASVFLKKSTFPGLDGKAVQILGKGTTPLTYRGSVQGGASQIDFRPSDIDKVQLRTPATPLLPFYA